MARLLLFFAARPWLGLGLLLAVSLLAATQVGRLEVHVSAEEMLIEGDPERLFYDEVREVFGEAEVVLLIVEDPRPLAADKLEVLREALEALAGLPFVARTESLFSIPYVRTVDGYLEKSPYLETLPENEIAEQALLAAARRNPLLDGIIVSHDSPAMAVAIVLDDTASRAGDQVLTEGLDAAIAPLQEVYEQAYTVGFARVRSEIAERIVAEQGKLLPFAIGALLIALFLLLRQLLDIVTPLLTAGISILMTFAMMAVLGVPVNVVTSTIPILLIVVGSTEDIHLLAEFRHAQRRGDPVPLAIEHMARKMGRTVLLTFITTWAGFLSVGLSGIEVLKQFGLIASTGLLFNFLVTVIFIPSALALAGRWRLDGGAPALTDSHHPWPQRYWQFLCRHRKGAFYAMSLVAAIAVTGMPRLETNHSPVDTLGSDSAAGQDIARLNTEFAGLESFSVVLDAGIQDTFLHVRYLGEIVALQEFIQSLRPEASVTSFGDYLLLLNRAFLEDPDAGGPETNDEIAELMLFLDHDRVAAHVNADYSRARVVVRHSIADTGELRAFLDQIQGYLETELDPGLNGRITGDSLLTLSATESMILGQVQSLALILGFFITTIAVLFTDVRVGLLAALPNVLPILLLFGVMGYAGIPLNIGTAMAGAVAIGVAVDGTLHFMLRYNQALRGSRSQSQAMHHTLYEEALPVVATSVALAGGFLVFALSDFEPVAQFGLLGALVIASALVADFVVTPLAIGSLRLVSLWDLLSPEVRQQVIPKSPLFRDMKPWQIRKFVTSSTQLAFSPGTPIYCHDDESHALFLVMSGTVEVRLPGSDKDEPTVVDTFGPGELFGDVAFLANERRKTDAVATTHTTLMVLSREGIEAVTFLNPFVASRLFLNLARDVSCRWVNFIMRVRRAKGDLATKDPE
jgi:predicted RND superfamily exporter protein